MMVVSYSVEGESFRAGRPRELFQGQFRLGNRPSADIAPDVPVPLREVIERLIEVDPGARTPSAMQLIDPF